MRKITSFYYLNYPDNQPNDPLDAFSEVYVEIGDEKSTINNFDETYSLMVYTLNNLKKMIKNKSYLVLKSVIIVDRFDDKTIQRALESVVDNIEEYGIKIGD